MPDGPHPLLYGDQQLEQIASAIEDDFDREKLKPFRERFESAAFWYHASLGGSVLIPDKKQKAAIEALANACARFGKYANTKLSSCTAQQPEARNLSRNLLKASEAILRRLGADKGSWDDRLPDRRLALLLSDEDDNYYDPEDRALRRLAAAIKEHEADLLAAMAAADNLSKRAKRGQASLERVRERSIRRGNSGDMVLNIWIDDHIIIYKALTGRCPGRSTKGTTGEPDGPLLRFLKASARVVGIEASDSSVYGFDQRVQRALDRICHNVQKKT